MRIVLLALLLPLAAAAAPKDGVECTKSKSPKHEGETHACVFEPVVRGARDFGSRNGRAEYVFTALGPDCEEMEILADEPVAESPDPAKPLRRVSVLCAD